MTAMDAVPLWILFLLYLVVSLLCIEAGYRFCRYCLKGTSPDANPSVGSMVSATLALLAFMLAFTFGVAISRFDERRLLVVEESNAIGTAYLRAEILEEPSRTNVQKLLREYLSARILGAQKPSLVQQTIAQSETLQGHLWSETADVGRKHPNWPAYSIFIQSMNEVIDIHSKRVAAALYSRVPASVWITLFGVSLLAMTGVGYYCGLSGRRDRFEVILMVAAFTTVSLIVVDLDRPGEGSIRVSQQPLIDLAQRISHP